jgi:circadian clock protein KaiB
LTKPENSDKLQLTLFITGASANSIRAVNNIRTICNTYIPEQYTLEIIDVYLRPEVAQMEQIIALPTLIKRHPLPERRFVGDLSDTRKVLIGLGIETHD